jgi:hypothetical protein
MAIQLKQLQTYRNTIILISVLAVIALVIATIVFTNNSRPKIKLSPGELPPTAPFGTQDPNEPKIEWNKVTLGKNPEEMNNLLGTPAKTENKEDEMKIYYTTTTINKFHVVTFIKNKAVRIDRFVNERKTRISAASYQQTYGDPEVLRKGEGIVFQVEGYKLSGNEYIVLVWDTQYDQVYLISDMTQDQYNNYKESEVVTSEIEDLPVEPDP